jgi:putative hydrolase of the HAD superfamily
VSAPDDPLRRVETWVFDLDNTLYSARHSLFDQVDRRITEYVSAFLGMAPEAARDLQKRYFLEHGTTLNGLVSLHACDPARYLAYVHDIDYGLIPADPALDEALGKLPGRKIVFTNGDVPHAERAMARLGIAHHFAAIFDIVESDYVPKPTPSVYDRLLHRHAIEGPRAAMFEDIARNLKPAKDRGMTTVWIEGPSRYAAAGADDGHIDHRTEDLTPWLVDLVRRLATG